MGGANGKMGAGTDGATLAMEVSFLSLSVDTQRNMTGHQCDIVVLVFETRCSTLSQVKVL